jgi:hypothetical protein
MFVYSTQLYMYTDRYARASMSERRMHRVDKVLSFFSSRPN